MVEKEMLTQNEMDQTLASYHVYNRLTMKQFRILTLFLNRFRKFLRQKLDTYEIIESVVSDKTIISSNTSTFPLKELTQRCEAS